MWVLMTRLDTSSEVRLFHLRHPKPKDDEKDKSPGS